MNKHLCGTCSSLNQGSINLYINGSCHKTEEGLRAGFAVVEQDQANYCSRRSSTPFRDELVALKEALDHCKRRARALPEPTILSVIKVAAHRNDGTVPGKEKLWQIKKQKGLQG